MVIQVSPNVLGFFFGLLWFVCFRACWLVWCCWLLTNSVFVLLAVANSAFIPLGRCQNGLFPKWLRLPEMLANTLSWEANKLFQRVVTLFRRANSSIVWGSGCAFSGSCTWEGCQNVENIGISSFAQTNTSQIVSDCIYRHILNTVVLIRFHG